MIYALRPDYEPVGAFGYFEVVPWSDAHGVEDVSGEGHLAFGSYFHYHYLPLTNRLIMVRETVNLLSWSFTRQKASTAQHNIGRDSEATDDYG